MNLNQFEKFTGLDLRRNAAAADPSSARLATNVNLTLGGGYRRRGALRVHATVSSESIGLFSANGELQVIVPGGQSIQDSRPSNILYAPVGDGTAYALGSLSKLHAVEVMGGPGLGKAYPYVAIERSTGIIEHHYLTANPASAATAVSTKVTLPFDPGRALVKAQHKLYADDPSNGVLRFSSTVQGPTNWTAIADAGSLAVRNFTVGEATITALGIFDKSLAVLFGDSVQLWDVSPDPARNQLRTVLNGPGTDGPNTVENVLGDLFYFSRGGFRSLSISRISGQPREGNIGDRIYELTKDLDLSDAVAVWSQSRSQYLCASGTTVYALTWNPSGKVTGWTTWELPLEVEHLVEHEGDLYVRAGDVIYVLDDEYERDFGTTAVEYDVRTQFLNGKAPGRQKRWMYLDLVQEATTELTFYVRPGNDDLVIAGPTLTGNSYHRGPLTIQAYSENLSIGFSGTSLWKLESFGLRFDVLTGVT